MRRMILVRLSALTLLLASSAVAATMTPATVSAGECWVNVAKVTDSAPPTTLASHAKAVYEDRTGLVPRLVSEVRVTLRAVDAGLAGVRCIYYRANGAATTGMVVDCGDTATFTIRQLGETTITFWAVDHNGNQELQKRITFVN